MTFQWNEASPGFHPASAPDYLPRRELEGLQLARLRARCVGPTLGANGSRQEDSP